MGYEKNQILTVKIEDMGADGEGIGKVEGYTLFVKDALMGDVVKAKIVKPKKNYAFARLEKIVVPSRDRVEPICPYHRQCGGCQIQAMSYEAQLRYKENKVRNHLMRIGKVEPALLDEVMEPIVGMQGEDRISISGSSGERFSGFRYRNKAQFPVGCDKDGKLITGFYAGRTHNIIANTDCMLGVRINQDILEAVLAYMQECHVSPYDETTGKGLVRHVLIREGFKTGEVMVCVVINGHELPESGRLTERLRAVTDDDCRGADQDSVQSELQQKCVETVQQTAWKMTSVSVNYNRENTNVILGKETKVLWGQSYITDYIKDVAFQISPQSFFQVNPIQTEKLYSKALEYAGLTGQETVWDLYCGIGTISLFLAKQAKQVYGVEIIPQAIEDAKNNAKINNISNAEFYVGKAEEVLPAFYEEEQKNSRKATCDVIVVDPPRKGCDEVCLNTMLKMQPDRIVYVSCDSATLARDLKILCEGGYELRRAQAYDQFGNTVHVETVVLLSKGVVDKDNFRKVKVDFSLEDMDLTELRGKATYAQVKEYILNEFGLKVSSLYIAQVKKKCGIETGENHNLPKSEAARQPQVTPEKEEAIMKAFRHFGVI